MDIAIETGTRKDLEILLELVRELAEFERAPEKVTNSVKAMEVDGFGPNRIFDFFLIKKDGELAGMIVTYFRYSTWRGRTLYLEDIYIKPEYRGLGIGKKAMIFLSQKAVEENCTRISWEVLDWNEKAINFYKGLGAEFDHEWVNCHLENENLKKLAGDA